MLSQTVQKQHISNQEWDVAVGVVRVLAVADLDSCACARALGIALRWAIEKDGHIFGGEQCEC